MLVEMCGIPGAGKSMVMDALGTAEPPLPIVWATDLQQRRSSRTPLVVGRAASLARQPVSTIAATSALAVSARTPAVKLDAFRYLVVSSQRIDEARRVPSSRLVLFDEGHVQRGMMYFLDRDRLAPGRLIDAYARAGPRNGLVVRVVVPVAAAVERLAARDRRLAPRFDGVDREGVLATLGRAEALIDRLLAWRSPGSVLTIDGTDPTTPSRVARWLREKVDGTER